MPEELAIIIVVLVIVGWVAIKLLQGIITGITEAHESLDGFLKKKTLEIFSNRKKRLAQHVRVFVPNQLEGGQFEIDLAFSEFQRVQSSPARLPLRPTWLKREFKPLLLNPTFDGWAEMNAKDIDSILRLENTSWAQTESAILAQSCDYPFDPPKNTIVDPKEFPETRIQLDEAIFEADASTITKKQLARYLQSEQKQVAEYNEHRSAILARCDDLNRAVHAWNSEERKRWSAYVKESLRLEKEELSKFSLFSQQYSRACKEQKDNISRMALGFAKGSRPEVIARIEHILGTLTLPSSVPQFREIDFDEEQRILIVEVALPDVVHRPPMKTVVLKSGAVAKPLNQTEKKEIIPKIHPAILLRFAYEIFRNDDAKIINLLVLNGWVRFDDPNTGINTKAYTASLMVERDQIEPLNLGKLDPLAAFQSLNGKSAGKLVEIIPIEPSLSLNKKDSRFVDAKAILNMLGTATNLAAMDWQDFEHLIRELFEKEFAERGAEVKITQASRDRGVDAIAFDPDPIHGGKYVIQAKRYTNTVDVSAVRDLCAVVRKEGASRGILVTTSTYGADAYAFANNEPVTLLNGAELLGLLKKHGYSFRINLQEARRLNVTHIRKETSMGES
jgi:restriction system protein